MSVKVPQHIQSAASENAEVHLRNFEGFPPHKGKRATEYKVVNKPLTCNFCIEIAEETQPPKTEIAPQIREELEDDDSRPETVTYRVTFDQLDPETKKIVKQIVVENVEAEGPMGAIEIAVSDHLRVTVVQEKKFVFNPGE